MKLFGNTRKSTHVATKSKSPRRILIRLSIVLACLAGLYLTAVYSNIPFIKKYRIMYIQTAMSTMRHQWLATAFIPKNVIDQVMADLETAKEAQIGVNSAWATDTPAATVSPSAGTVSASAEPEEEEPDDFIGYEIDDEASFYTVFWELDQDTMQSYLDEHPDALDNGWEGIQINEAGLDDDGTDIQTTMGEQVLAIDAPNKILLVRVEGTGYRGVLAIAKDTSRLSICNATTLGSVGQVAGQIAEDNDGILAMTASSFIDNSGVGNGGTLAGYCMSHGEGHGDHMGWSYKRLEIRNDNRMYIVDTQSDVDEDTRDAVEFTPALIVDGETLVDENCGWTDTNPRACIGESDKLESLMIVIEGRQPLAGILGCSVVEVAKIFQKHNCQQALNLDGGTSAIMYYDGEYITKCSNSALPSGRTLPNAFVYKKSDN